MTEDVGMDMDIMDDGLLFTRSIAEFHEILNRQQQADTKEEAKRISDTMCWEEGAVIKSLNKFVDAKLDQRLDGTV